MQKYCLLYATTKDKFSNTPPRYIRRKSPKKNTIDRRTRVKGEVARATPLPTAPETRVLPDAPHAEQTSL